MRVVTLALILILSASGRAENEPQDVLVEGYRFTRPAPWKWTPPTKGSTALTRFVVPGKNGGSRTDVRFYFFENDLRQRMVEVFEKNAEVTDVPAKVGNVELVYVTVTGT